MRFSSETQDKEYRHGLVAAQIEVDLPLQIRAIRKQQKLTQPELATLADMKQSRISKMEQPGGAHFTLETLRRLAVALDVALVVRFAPFSELLTWSDNFDPDTFSVPKFDDDPGLIERKEPEMAILGGAIESTDDCEYSGHETVPSNVVMFPSQAGTPGIYASTTSA